MNPQNSPNPFQPTAPQPVSNLTSPPEQVDPKRSIIDRLQQANSILITVSNNPSLDQLSACIGFSLFLNKIGKHATAVFSGEVPSSIEFLQPEETIEKDTDSLRDFIISLDKTKADKLRYKVEDDVVKIFITPYKTSLSKDDFDFGQGEFNVDVVVALGVHKKEDIDRAVSSHGRILHDATVISITNSPGGSPGTLNLQDEKASSLCEMMADISESLQANNFDAQMATAFLTGIVAETKRFSNEKTTSLTMSLSAKLMAAGANQQLVATNLQAVPGPIKKVQSNDKKDGELTIDHTLDEKDHPTLEHPVREKPKPISRRTVVPPPRSPINDVKTEDHREDASSPLDSNVSQSSDTAPSYPVSPPTMGGTLTANTKPEASSRAVNPLEEKGGIAPSSDQPVSNSKDLSGKTLSDIEKTVGSSHVPAEDSSTGAEEEPNSSNSPQPNLDAARDEVLKAVEGASQNSSPAISNQSNDSSSGEVQSNTQANTSEEQSTPKPASPPPPVPPPMMPPS